MNRALILFVILATNAACDPVDDKLKVSNQSDKTVHYLITKHSDLDILYKEVLEKQGVAIEYRNVVKELRANSSRSELRLGSRGAAWDEYINGGENGKLYVYTFNIDTLKRYSFKEIIDNKRYTLRQELTIEDLDTQGWHIYFD